MDIHSTKPRRAIVLACLALVALMTAPAVAAVSDATRTNMIAGDGQRLGNVRFSEFPTYVLVRVELSGLAPGIYGLAVHENGDCQRPDFLSAGDHWDLGNSAHPNHTGDLLPILVMADGTTNAQYRIDSFRMADLLAGDGSSIVLAAEPDNFAHIPTRYQSSLGGPAGPDAVTLATGDTGARLACGVVRTK